VGATPPEQPGECEGCVLRHRVKQGTRWDHTQGRDSLCVALCALGLRVAVRVASWRQVFACRHVLCSTRQPMPCRAVTFVSLCCTLVCAVCLLYVCAQAAKVAEDPQRGYVFASLRVNNKVGDCVGVGEGCRDVDMCVRWRIRGSGCCGCHSVCAHSVALQLASCMHTHHRPVIQTRSRCWSCVVPVLVCRWCWCQSLGRGCWTRLLSHTTGA
jgi:hypothetical protein